MTPTRLRLLAGLVALVASSAGSSWSPRRRRRRRARRGRRSLDHLDAIEPFVVHAHRPRPRRPPAARPTSSTDGRLAVDRAGSAGRHGARPPPPSPPDHGRAGRPVRCRRAIRLTRVAILDYPIAMAVRPTDGSLWVARKSGAVCRLSGGSCTNSQIVASVSTGSRAGPARHRVQPGRHALLRQLHRTRRATSVLDEFPVAGERHRGRGPAPERLHRRTNRSRTTTAATSSFGPDGRLYLGLGDGGGGGDQHGRSATARTPTPTWARSCASTRPGPPCSGGSAASATRGGSASTAPTGPVGGGRRAEHVGGDRPPPGRRPAGPQPRLALLRGHPPLQLLHARRRPHRSDPRVRPRAGLLRHRRLRVPRVEDPRARGRLPLLGLLRRADPGPHRPGRAGCATSGGSAPTPATSCRSGRPPTATSTCSPRPPSSASIRAEVDDADAAPGAARRRLGRAHGARRPRRLGARPARGPASTGATWPPTRPPSPCSTAAGLGAMSEESGLHDGDRDVVVVLDPVDGSTNASRGLPWYATSLCAVDRDGARAALVVDQASGQRFEATRGGGARVDGRPLAPSRCDAMDEAVVGLSGYPPRWFGWKQFRALGCAGARPVRGGRAVASTPTSTAAPTPTAPGTTSAGCSSAGRRARVVVDAWDRELVTARPRRPPHARWRRPRPRCSSEAVAARRAFIDEEPWAGERDLA